MKIALPTGWDGLKMYKGFLNRLCSSSDGGHLGPEKGHLPTRQLIKNGSTDAMFDPPLFSLVSTVPRRLFIPALQ